jgi:teichuronic acid biosynthesis glycosyltransferase TuaH
MARDRDGGGNDHLRTSGCPTVHRCRVTTPASSSPGTFDRSEVNDLSVLILSTADWDAPLWTNKQYMAVELAQQYDVTYVESLGLRRPQLSKRDMSRMLTRLRRSRSSVTRGPHRPVPARVDLASPLVVPVHRGPLRHLNRRNLARAVSSWVDGTDGQRVLWTYSPETYGLETGADLVVYHCVDLMAEWPGIDRKVVLGGERTLADSGAVAIGSSPAVCDHLRRQGFAEVLHWPNVAPVDRFTAAALPAEQRARRVVFGGNLTPAKLDLSFVAAIVDRHPDLEVVLAGPVSEGGGGAWSDLAHLERRGVHRTGVLSIEDLARLYGSSSVGVIPYARNEYTEGVSPLKTYEYMAAGLAVVAAPLPSLAPDGQDLICEETPEGFADRVAAVAGLTNSDISRRQNLAASHSWRARGQEARAFVSDRATEGPRRLAPASLHIAVDEKRPLVVHEWVSGRKGSEKVFEALAELLPDADLLALSAEPDHGLRLDPRRLRTTWLDQPYLRSRKAASLPLMPIAWWSTRLDDYSMAVTSHHAAAHHVGRRLDCPHLVYVHTPARYIWSPELDGRASSPLLRPARELLMTLDRNAAQRPTSYAANSSAVAARIAEYWDRDASVIHPPVDVEFYRPSTPDEPTLVEALPFESYVLGVSRFVPYKRLETVIGVGEDLGMPVVLAGSGPDEDRLRARAAHSTVPVRIETSPSDLRLRALYQGAACFVFPAVEDFGIVMVEAQACGTPVVAPGAGGALDIVQPEIGGVLAPTSDVADLTAAAERAMSLDRGTVRASTERFRPTTFACQVERWIERHT